MKSIAVLLIVTYFNTALGQGLIGINITLTGNSTDDELICSASSYLCFPEKLFVPDDINNITNITNITTTTTPIPLSQNNATLYLNEILSNQNALIIVARILKGEGENITLEDLFGNAKTAEEMEAIRGDIKELFDEGFTMEVWSTIYLEAKSIWENVTQLFFEKFGTGENENDQAVSGNHTQHMLRYYRDIYKQRDFYDWLLKKKDEVIGNAEDVLMIYVLRYLHGNPVSFVHPWIAKLGLNNNNWEFKGMLYQFCFEKYHDAAGQSLIRGMITDEASHLLQKAAAVMVRWLHGQVDMPTTTMETSTNSTAINTDDEDEKHKNELLAISCNFLEMCPETCSSLLSQTDLEIRQAKCKKILTFKLLNKK